MGADEGEGGGEEEEGSDTGGSGSDDSDWEGVHLEPPGGAHCLRTRVSSLSKSSAEPPPPIWVAETEEVTLIRRQLEQLYAKYRPEYVLRVDELLLKHYGAEDELLAKVSADAHALPLPPPPPPHHPPLSAPAPHLPVTVVRLLQMLQVMQMYTAFP